MSDRTEHEPSGESATADERPATPTEEGVKTGMHRPGQDPHKQIPATEGGET